MLHMPVCSPPNLLLVLSALMQRLSVWLYADERPPWDGDKGESHALLKSKPTIPTTVLHDKKAVHAKSGLQNITLRQSVQSEDQARITYNQIMLAILPRALKYCRRCRDGCTMAQVGARARQMMRAPAARAQCLRAQVPLIWSTTVELPMHFIGEESSSLTYWLLGGHLSVL